MVIVGAGKAGARAVVGLREHSWHGSITLIGEETLLQTLELDLGSLPS